MDANRERRPALAAGERDTALGRPEQRLQLAEPLVDPGQLGAALLDQVLTKVVAAVHLHHQPAEVAQPLLADALERAPLAADHTRRRERTARRLRVVFPAKEAHQPNSGMGATEDAAARRVMAGQKPEGIA